MTKDTTQVFEEESQTTPVTMTETQKKSNQEGQNLLIHVFC